MHAWQWLLDSAGAVLLLVFGYGLLLVLRRRVISRNGGTFELSVRVGRRGGPSDDGRGWVLGIGRYHDENLQWFRIFWPLPRPSRDWHRGDLRIVGHREPSGAEAFALYAGARVIECRTPEGIVELAMSTSALTGFSAWLEAAPPGTDWEQRPNN